jgi:hypothetical protein
LPVFEWAKLPEAGDFCKYRLNPYQGLPGWGDGTQVSDPAPDLDFSFFGARLGTAVPEDEFGHGEFVANEVDDSALPACRNIVAELDGFALPIGKMDHASLQVQSPFFGFDFDGAQDRSIRGKNNFILLDFHGDFMLTKFLPVIGREMRNLFDAETLNGKTQGDEEDHAGEYQPAIVWFFHGKGFGLVGLDNPIYPIP